ncbi:hypothetical protein [Lysobacter fragariae]
MKTRILFVEILASSVAGWIVIFALLFASGGLNTPISSAYIATLYAFLCVPGLIGAWITSSARRGISWKGIFLIVVLINVALSLLFDSSLITQRTKGVGMLFVSGIVTTLSCSLVFLLVLAGVRLLLSRKKEVA